MKNKLKILTFYLFASFSMIGHAKVVIGCGDYSLIGRKVESDFVLLHRSLSEFRIQNFFEDIKLVKELNVPVGVHYTVNLNISSVNMNRPTRFSVESINLSDFNEIQMIDTKKAVNQMTKTVCR
jgi:hypothetical protein